MSNTTTTPSGTTQLPPLAPLPYGKEIEVFFDGACPLCAREIKLLKRWDKLKRIQFTDISLPAFDAASLGRAQDDLMSQITGRLPDGTLIQGMEVFRRLYSAVGFRWAANLTRIPVVSQLCDLGYRLFAKNRLRLTGRCNAETCSIHAGDHNRRA